MPIPIRPARRPGADVFDSVLSFITVHMNRCIDGLRAGNREAADELVRRAEGRFRRLVLRMYRGFPNVRPVAEADDVVVDAWMRLLRTLQQLRPANTGQFFLLAGVEIRRELIDLARKAKTAKYQTRSLECIAAGGDGSSGGFDVADPADRRDRDIEQWEQFHLAVGQLREHLQQVVMLIFYDGRTQAETAAILKKDVRTVGRYWKHACYDIRELVGEWTPPGN